MATEETRRTAVSTNFGSRSRYNSSAATPFVAQTRHPFSSSILSPVASWRSPGESHHGDSGLREVWVLADQSLTA
ncbi:hypothetical protein RRG08_059427 [Elysia crispata]|uniref:Uncharacterized protein n=1 Tax=Elysia crispata TaxID=231223 RepID=A0AAE1DS64_9GAST|nr:hypothetical protein RRG08_059427 [Elysia crispata]